MATLKKDSTKKKAATPKPTTEKKVTAKKKGEVLPERQRMLIDEYLICLNWTEAALKVGYSKNYAEAKAQMMVGKTRESSLYPLMWDYFQKKVEKKEKEFDIKASKVLEEFASIGLSDIRKLFNANGTMKDIVDLDDNTAKCISSVKIEEVTVGKGKSEKKVGIIKHVKLWDKNNALANIAKMLGYNSPDKVVHDIGPTFAQLLKKVRKTNASRD